MTRLKSKDAIDCILWFGGPGTYQSGGAAPRSRVVNKILLTVLFHNGQKSIHIGA